jgi:hypothetical protein
MRTSLAILALVLGCVGCQQKQTATQQVAVPIPEPGERPSFYETNNDMEYYGRCLKCHHWVKGYRSNVTFADKKSGKLVGCEPRVTGTCQYCRVFLFADESASLTNESRIVRWTPPVSAPADELDGRVFGLVVTNVSPFVFPK